MTLKSAASSETVGVVLAGGASRRMGRDKTTLELAGQSLAALTARHLDEVCATVVIADRGRNLVPGFDSVGDAAGVGPGAGLLGAAEVHPRTPLLVLACDLPSVPVALLRALLALEGDLVVPRWSRQETPQLEPLCAVYRPPALDRLRQRLQEGHAALYPLARDPELEVCLLEGRALDDLGEPAKMFANLNTPEDWHRLVQS